MTRRITALACAGLLLSLSPLTQAQVAPDAGRLLEEGRTGGVVPPKAVPPLPPREPARPAMGGDASVKVRVNAFRITGNTRFSEEELRREIASFTGRELTLAELEQAAARISRFYRVRGYFVARAYLPQQDIHDGVVEITVLEGLIGALQVEREGNTRIRESVVRDTVAGHQPQGSVIEQKGLERGLLLLNDLPGMAVQSTLSPGQDFGTSDVQLRVIEGPLVTSSADLDDYGSRFTGRWRLGVSGWLNDPSGWGDQGSLRLTKASGLELLRLGYSLPLGSNGLRISTAYTTLAYELCCQFAPLGAKGRAQETNLAAQYPILRSRDRNLYASLGLSRKVLFNETITGTSSDKRVESATLSLNGDTLDEIFGGAFNSASLAFTAGRLDLGHWAPDRAADTASAQTQGDYRKLAYSVTRLQRLHTTLSLALSVNGQVASKNLDSSEQISLGGPYAVRGYPSGEAVGDEGVVASAELRWEVAPGWQWSVFLDHGRIRLHKNPWTGWEAGNANLRNRYNLAAAGTGLSWSRPGNFHLRLVVAWKLGTNPGQSPVGLDSDSRNDSHRAWVQLVKML